MTNSVPLSRQEAAPTDASFSTRGLTGTIPLVQTALAIVYTTVPAYLIPIQVQNITGSPDVGALGSALTLGAVAAAVANPVVGLLSDRTRSRFGRRTPWVLGAALAGALVLVLMANASTIVLVALAYAGTWSALNAVQAAFYAVIPDRVPALEYNKYSGLVGLGMNLGAVIPSAIFAIHPELASPAAYRFLGLVVLVSAVAFVRLSPDQSSTHQTKVRLSRRDIVSVFWINPRKAPDFAIAFVARLLLLFGYWLVFTLFYYLLQDYIGLKPTAAISALGVIFLVNGVAAVAGAWVSSIVGKRIRRLKLTVLVSGLLLALSSLIPLFYPTYTALLPWAVVNGFAFGVYISVDTSLAVYVLPSSESAAKDLGIFNFAGTIPIVLSGSVGAVLVTYFGYTGLLVVASVVAAAGAVAVQAVKSVD